MQLWHRVSPDAGRRVLRAEEIARQLRASAPEHLALGIIEIGEGPGFTMLQRLGMNLTRLQQALLAAAPVGVEPSPADLSLSSQPQRCLQSAYVEWQKHVAACAHTRGQPAAEPSAGPRVGAEQPTLESVHLLLGLLAPSSAASVVPSSAMGCSMARCASCCAASGGEARGMAQALPGALASCRQYLSPWGCRRAASPPY